MLLYHLFGFSVFYKAGIGGRLSSDGAQVRYTLGMVTPPPVTSSVLSSQRCDIFIIWFYSLYFSMFSYAKLVLRMKVPTGHNITDFNALIIPVLRDYIYNQFS